MEISDVKRNAKLLIEGIPYNVEGTDFTKPGKGRAIYRFKLRNLLDSSTLDRTYHSGEKVDEADISTVEMQYLYREGDHYVFMNTETFDQTFLTEEQVGNKKAFLKEGTVITVSMFGDKPIDITLPTFVELKITGSRSVGKTDTITAQSKASTLETGFIIGVPTFINEGDIIKVDTRTGTYVERISKA